jgi:transcriptional regulator with XRE-family HTH domain
MNKFNEQMTLTEVAAELGISRQRVKQIENVALEKLRNNAKVRGLYEGIVNGRMGSDYRFSDTVYNGNGRSRAW